MRSKYKDPSSRNELFESHNCYIDAVASCIELRMRKYDDVIRKMAVSDHGGGYVDPEFAQLFREMEESYKESPEAFQRFLDKYEVMKVNS